MTTVIILVISALCMVGLVMLILALLPVAYAYNHARQENEKEQIANNLKIARTRKIEADQEVLESRRAKLDSEVAILELRIEKARRDMGMDADFKPANYD